MEVGEHRFRGCCHNKYAKNRISCGKRGRLLQKLDRLMDISARSLHIKRTVITKLLDEGLYPYTKRYLGTFDNHFSTIGLIGMNEACLNAKWIRKDLTDAEAQQFTKMCLTYA